MDTNYLRKISEHEDSISKHRLPTFVYETIDKFLHPKNPNSSYEYLVLCVMSLASYLLCYQRVKIQRTETDSTFPNMYGIAFSPSGSYKDKPFDDMKNHILGFLQEDLEILNEHKGKKEAELLLQEAEDLYGTTKDGNPTSKCFGHIDKHRTHDLVSFFKSGTTPSGLLALREAFQSADRGSPFLMIGELINLLSNKSESDASMLSLVEELFNHGYNDAVVLKGNRKSKMIKDVPQVAWFHSSFEGVLENENVRKDLINSLNRQMARRSIFYFPMVEAEKKIISEDVSQEDVDRKFAMEMEAEKNIGKISGIFEGVFRNLYTDPETKSGSAVIKMSKEANMLYLVYREWCDLRSRNAHGDVSIEIGGRHFKAFKISGIYAGFENPNKGCTKENMEDAIYFVEYYSDHYLRLIEQRLSSFGSHIIDYLLRGKTWVGTTKLRDQYFVKHNMFSQRFRDEYPLIHEECFIRNLIWLERPFGVNGREYDVIRAPDGYSSAVGYIKKQKGDMSEECIGKMFGCEVVKSLKLNPSLFKQGIQGNFYINNQQ